MHDPLSLRTSVHFLVTLAVFSRTGADALRKDMAKLQTASESGQDAHLKDLEKKCDELQERNTMLL